MPRVDYRLQIEGCPDQWVTSDAYAGTFAEGTDSHRRIPGFQYDGLQIEENLKLRDFDVALSSMTVKIRHEYARESFAKRAIIVSYLDAAVNGSATSWYVRNFAAFTYNHVYHVGTEAIKAGNISSNPIPVERQYLDTQAQAHYYATGAHQIETPIYDKPPTLEGRRCYLFMYLDGEPSDTLNTFNMGGDPTGATRLSADHLIWRGVIASAPALDGDGLTWVLRIEPLTMLLEQEMSGNKDATRGIQGIYHSAEECICIYFKVTHDAVSVERNIKISGFWSTEADLLTALQSNLAGIQADIEAAIPDCITNIWIVGDKPGEYSLMFTTGATCPDTLIAFFLSNAEGQAFFNPIYSGSPQTPSTPPNMFLWPSTIYGAPLGKDTIVGPLAYYGGDPDADKFGAQAPRGWIIPPYPTNGSSPIERILPYVVANEVTDNSAALTSPSKRIYYNGDIGNVLVAGDHVLIETKGYWPIEYELAHDPNTTSGYFDVLDALNYAPPADMSYLGWFGAALCLNAETEITPISISVRGSIGDLVDEIVSRAYLANAGNVPFITGADLADWNTLLGTLTGFAGSRAYSFAKPVTIREVLREELKLIGYFMCLDADGRITIRLLRLPISTTAGLISIGKDEIITPYDNGGMWPNWQTNTEGIISEIVIYDQYDFINDTSIEHYRIKDEASISTHKNRSRGTIEIKAVAGGIINDLEAIDIANRILTVLDKDYEIIKIKVPFKYLYDWNGAGSALRIGTMVSLTCPQIPDTLTGLLGVVNRPCLVIGRKWNLDGKEGAAGEITLWAQSGNRAGYAPALRILDATNITGNTWVLIVEEQFFAPSTAYDTAYFAAGYTVEVVEFDTFTPPVPPVAGTVDSIDSSTSITVTFAGVAPWGATFSGVYDLRFKSYDVNTMAGQKQYVFIADSDCTVFGNEKAFVLA